MVITVKSSAFVDGAPIPSTYTCDGRDVSPPLSWDAVPEQTASLALICDDPDAPVGTWVHWVVFDLAPDARGLPEGVAKQEAIPSGGVQGINDWKRPGYGGPCPPSGTHRYFFKLYALDSKLDLRGKVTKDQLLKAMQGHVLAEGQLMGTYARKR
jgi:Raf kinase inhibitor-like YbhB/YbcL family protein